MARPTSPRAPELVAASLALAALLAAPAARAQEGPAPPAEPGRPSPRPVRLAVGAGTDFPVSAGARLELEVGSRLRLSSSLGVLPGPYVDVINDAVVGMGGYDDETADLVRGSIERALVWRTHAGARLWRGLHVEAGYGLAALGGGGTAGEVLALVTDEPLPPGEGDARAFDVESTLHLVGVEVGWTFTLGGGWRLGTALGGAFTFAASTRIRPRYTPLSPEQAAAFARAAEAYLDDVTTSYVHTPVLSVSVSRVIF